MTIHPVRVLVAAVAVFVLASVAAGSALGDQAYPDATGDGGTGPDVTGVTVKNDTAGVVTIDVAMAAPIAASQLVFVFIDSDKNQTTGDSGDDYVMLAGISGGALLKWNGSALAPVTVSSFSVASAAGNVIEFKVAAADLGGTKSFAFAVGGVLYDAADAVVASDGAPEAGYFTYDLVFTQCANGVDDDGDGKIDGQDLGCASAADDNEADDPVHVKLGPARVLPARPKPGAKAVVGALTQRVETGKSLSTATVTCSAKIVGGAKLRATGGLQSGVAICIFKIPATAKNKPVRGTIRITFKGATATTPVAFRTARK